MPTPESMPRLDADSLYQFLQAVPATNHYVLAISGGLDSCVLLHLFSELLPRLNASAEVVYVDHGLQPESVDWQRFCAEQAAHYGLAFHAHRIAATPPGGESTENWARTERYKLLAGHIAKKSLLLTAHHLDDQVETFFLQALRGAGLKGMSAMPIIRKLGEGWLARPLLSITRQQLVNYARANHLEHVEDKSNQDDRFDRNYLRNEVLPALEQRWPAYRKTLSRLMGHIAEASESLEAQAQEDLTSVLDAQQQALNLDKLLLLTMARQKNLILYWARKRQLATPGSAHLQRILSDVVNSAVDASPCVNWGDVECRRYRRHIYLDTSMPEHNPESIITWNVRNDIDIQGGRLSATASRGHGIAQHYLLDGDVSVRFRQGGERICPAPAKQNKTLKQLYQEKGVIPWQRDRVPLIFIDNQLAVVPGVCVASEFMATGEEASFIITWTGLSNAGEACE